MSKFQEKPPASEPTNTYDPALIWNTKLSPDEALEILKAGNERFLRREPVHMNTEAERLELCGVENQRDHAYATVIACSDSRVPVERIFDAGVMDLFVIRVAGNVFTPATIGSIEYGLAHVHTPLLIVLGHSQCGAVTATANAIAGGTWAPEKHIESLLTLIRPAVERTARRYPNLAPDAIVPYAIEENIWKGIEDLFRESPTVRKIVESGYARVIGAYYHVNTGVVDWLPEEKVKEIYERFKMNQ